MIDIIVPILIGLAAGFFSGQFGIGGGFLMQPALRLIVGAPALISLGTPFPVIIASAITGAYNYYRSGFVDMRLTPFLAAFGAIGAVLGAYTVNFIEGDLLLLITALALIVTSLRFIRATTRVSEERPYRFIAERPSLAATITGGIVGYFSGLLGLGGGFLLVPALTILFKRDMKTALGTSLLVIIAYAIPASVTHYIYGRVDPMLTLLLMAGIIPGAYFGSRIAIGLPDTVLRRMFGVFLFTVAVYFAIFEIRALVTGE